MEQEQELNGFDIRRLVRMLEDEKQLEEVRQFFNSCKEKKFKELKEEFEKTEGLTEVEFYKEKLSNQIMKLISFGVVIKAVLHEEISNRIDFLSDKTLKKLKGIDDSPFAFLNEVFFQA